MLPWISPAYLMSVFVPLWNVFERLTDCSSVSPRYFGSNCDLIDGIWIWSIVLEPRLYYWPNFFLLHKRTLWCAVFFIFNSYFNICIQHVLIHTYQILQCSSSTLEITMLGDILGWKPHSHARKWQHTLTFNDFPLCFHFRFPLGASVFSHILVVPVLTLDKYEELWPV